MPENKDLIGLKEAIKEVAQALGISYEEAEKMLLEDLQNGEIDVYGIRS